MKYLLLLLLVTSCGMPKYESKNNLEHSEEEIFVPEELSSFIDDASKYGITVSGLATKFYLSDSVEHVSCSGDDVLINKTKWANLQTAMVNPERQFDYPNFKQSIKAYVYKGMALCYLKQSPRNRFNKYDTIVPVPSSLTYKYGVSNSWLVNYCQNDSGFGIYPSLDECDVYHRKSFWDSYVEELFTLDDKDVLQDAWNFYVITKDF